MKTLSFVLVACLSAMVLVACTDGSTSNSSTASDIPDFWAPTVLSTTPVDGAVLPSNASISIAATFSEAVDPSTVNTSTFLVAGLTGTVTYSGTTTTFTPATPLASNTSYTATITTGITDFASNAMSSNYSWSFATTVPDLTPPTLSSTNPANSATAVAVGATLTATFSEAMDPATITTSSFTLMNGTTPISGTVTYSGMTATFTPAAPLTANVVYTATISTGVKDLAGNPIVSNYSWNFSTDALFMSFATTPTGSSPEAVAIGDVNGDGRNDVVMTTSSINEVLVFLQSATGGLSPPIKYAITGTASPRTVAIGDMNHDGKNDVVIGDWGSGIEVFVQNVVGGLNPGVVYASTDSDKIRVADLNNDGWLDVVGIGWGTNTTSVWLQNAGGTLNAPVVYNVTHGGYDDLEIGDVNNDGLTDIVVMSGQLYADPNLGILTQKLGGTFNAPAYYSVGVNVLTHGVAVGDVNGDSLNDVVVTYGGNSPSSTIGVFSQNTSGTLDPVVNYTSYDSPSPVEIADVTGDGRKDIVVHHGGWMAMGVYQQLVNGTLQAEKLYPAPYGNINPQSLAVGDINGDGKNDAVIVDVSGLSLLYHY